MAGLADHKGLASHFRHDFRPHRSRFQCVEISEFTDVMDLNLALVLADLASTDEESTDQLRAPDDDRGYRTVGEDRVSLSFQRDTAEPCDQWLAALAALTADLQTFTWTMGCVDGGRVFGRHLGHR